MLSFNWFLVLSFNGVMLCWSFFNFLFHRRCADW
jgi:hypothetical protein